MDFDDLGFQRGYAGMKAYALPPSPIHTMRLLNYADCSLLLAWGITNRAVRLRGFCILCPRIPVLTNRYLNLTLRDPFVAGSSGLSYSVAGVLLLEEVGAVTVMP